MAKKKRSLVEYVLRMFEREDQIASGEREKKIRHIKRRRNKKRFKRINRRTSDNSNEKN